MATRLRIAAAAAGGLALAGLGGAVAFHRAGEGPDGAATPYSREVVDRQGRLLRPFQTDDDMWRFPGAIAEVDPLFLRMLTAFEDRRFASHPGVDPLALVRAGGQWLRNGRIVSGGSTLSMQVARLIDKREDGRTMAVKLREMARAVRLERELGKQRVLDLYLSLAPYGGNVEGIRAASLAYFGKEPRRLSPGEAALLVAIPQSPEARRPDRHPEAARRARDRVLDRMLLAGVLKPEQVASGKAERVPVARRQMPTFAWHASGDAVAARPAERVHRMTYDRTVQETLEALLRERVRALGTRLSGALIAIDHRSGQVIARIGAADPLDAERQGAVDMTRAVRSPGSDAEALHLRHGLRGRARPSRNTDRGPPVALRHLCAGQFRPRLPGHGADPGGAADVAERAGRGAAGGRWPAAVLRTSRTGGHPPGPAAR
jgi:penicillin-binding protein 1C